MKRLLRPVWWLYATMMSRKRVHDEATAIVVLGMQRGGTSLVCDMVHALGVTFGDSRKHMTPDTRNPNGFFEDIRLKKTLTTMLRQAGYVSSFSEGKPLRAIGILNKAQRLFSRYTLQNLLRDISSKSTHGFWGVKSFPIFYYFLKSYLPKRKVIAVYRDPRAVGASFMAAWPTGFLPFNTLVEYWTSGMEDVLYHLASESDTLLIKYEDLLDAQTRTNTLDRVHAFIGHGERSALDRIVNESLNRSSHTVQTLTETYPLPERTKHILVALDVRARM